MVGGPHRHRLADHPSPLRTRIEIARDDLDREFLVQAVKVTLSATLAWAVAGLFMPGTTPIYAPITACFIAVVTVRASLTDAAQRTVAVVVGIGVAYFVGSVFGLTVWTVTLLTGVGLVIGRLLRLPRASATQVPISGLLIMAVGATPGQVGHRLIETVVGVAVPVVINLLIAPPNHVTAGSRAVGRLVERLTEVTTDMADGISRRWSRDDAADWLVRARSNGAVADTAVQAVDAGADSLRLRPASPQHQSDQGRIDTAMETLRVVEIQIRVIGRTLRDTADSLVGADGTLPPVRMGADLLAVTGEVLAAFGSAVLEDDPVERARAAAQAGDLIDAAAATAAAMSRDIADMTAAAMSRGVGDAAGSTAAGLTRALHLSALVVETGRVLDELRDGLRAARVSPR